MSTRITKFIIIYFSFLYISPVYAASSKVWMNEVNTFRGIQIGSNVLELYIECPRSGDTQYRGDKYLHSYDNNYPNNFKGVPCYKKVDDNALSMYVTQPTKESELFDIDNLVSIQGFGSEARVVSINNRIISIEATFTILEEDVIFSALIDKYGNPSSLKINEYQNGYGQRFQRRLAIWQGKKVTLIYNEYNPLSNYLGTIEMHSVEYYEKLSEDSNKDKENIKKGF